MKETVFPFTCKCVVKINEFNNYELELKNLPNPAGETETHTIITTGRTLGEAFFNMGHYSMLSFEKLFPGLLNEGDSVKLCV